MYKYEGDKFTIDANNYRMGDKRANVLAHGFCLESNHIKVLNLTNNRITSKGAEQILPYLQDTFETVNLSNNRIGDVGVGLVVNLL